MCGWNREQPLPHLIWTRDAPTARLDAIRADRLRGVGTPLPTKLAAKLLFHGLSGVALALVLGSCAKRDSTTATSASAQGQVLRLSQRNEPASLDPATTALPDEFGTLRALLEGLLVPGPAGSEPLPGVAERFAVSSDGLVYTFHLRSTARWSDGQTVTADHLVDAYRRVLTPGTAAPKASVFFPVKNARAYVSGTLQDFSAVGLKAVDAQTLQITLAQPTPSFPRYVASGPWLPVRADIVAHHGRHWTRPENFVGNGPFLLAEWRADQRVVVKRNPHWHGAAKVALAEIQFIRFDNGDSEDRAYRAGQIDATMAVPFSKVLVYARERPAELHRAPMIETRYLAFNTRRPALPRDVRLALSLAIDRAKITERVLQGGQSPAFGFVPPLLQPAAASTGTAVRRDPTEARRLLAQAGFPRGAGFPRLELSGWTQSQVLEAVQQMWREELGIEVAIAVREAKVHLDALRSGDFDIAFVTSIPDVADPAAMLEDFTDRAPLNYPGWHDREFDSALAAGNTVAAEARLLAEAAVAPLYFNTKIWLMSPRVRQWQEDGLWGRCYQGVSLASP